MLDRSKQRRRPRRDRVGIEGRVVSCGFGRSGPHAPVTLNSLLAHVASSHVGAKHAQNDDQRDHAEDEEDSQDRTSARAAAVADATAEAAAAITAAATSSESATTAEARGASAGRRELED